MRPKAKAPETLEEKQARLEQRLRVGFERIGEAMNQGIAVENWERHWIDILREYEQVSDEIAAAHQEGAAA